MNKIIYDWLSFTSKVHSPEEIKRLLGLSNANWQQVKGAHGYQDRWFYESISIHYNGREDMGVWCEMSGQGCRAYETLGLGDFEYLFNLIMNTEHMKITRLDVAFDDHTGILDIDKLCKDTLNDNFVTVFDNKQVIFSTGGNSILHGSKKSDIIIRIYDKAKERNCEAGTHWVRVEIQMRRDRAMSFLRAHGDIGYKFSGVLNNYLRYVRPTKDSNKRRWPLRLYWKKLLEHSERISIYEKPGMEYNENRLYNYVINQAGGAIYTYLKIHSAVNLIEELKERKIDLNPKYKKLIEDYEYHTKNLQSK